MHTGKPWRQHGMHLPAFLGRLNQWFCWRIVDGIGLTAAQFGAMIANEDALETDTETDSVGDNDGLNDQPDEEMGVPQSYLPLVCQQSEQDTLDSLLPSTSLPSCCSEDLPILTVPDSVTEPPIGIEDVTVPIDEASQHVFFPLILE